MMGFDFHFQRTPYIAMWKIDFRERKERQTFHQEVIPETQVTHGVIFPKYSSVEFCYTFPQKVSFLVMAILPGWSIKMGFSCLWFRPLVLDCVTYFSWKNRICHSFFSLTFVTQLTAKHPRSQHLQGGSATCGDSGDLSLGLGSGWENRQELAS